MRLKPCLAKNPYFTDDEKKDLMAEVNEIVTQVTDPRLAETIVVGQHLKDLRKDRAKVAGAIINRYKRMVKEAKAAGKPIYEPGKKPPPEEKPPGVIDIEKPPKQLTLAGFAKNAVFRDILIGELEPTATILEKRISTKEFDSLNIAMGFPTYGTKAQRIERFLDLYNLRKQMQQYAATFEGAQKYQYAHTKAQLIEQANRAKVWKSGNKVQIAGALLGWRDRTRRRGLKAVIDAYEAAGQEPPKQFTEAIKTQIGTIGKEVEPEPLSDYARHSRELADWVVDRIENQKIITWQDLFKRANRAYGGTQAEGVYTPRDAYDAMELGVNRYILQNLSFITPQGARKAPELIIRQLKQIGDLLPTQTKRTQEQEEFQQFSTPPFLAFAANHVANIRRGDIYLEPSGGIGGLSIFGKMSDADTVYVNELSKRRLDLLRVLDFDGYFNEDAAQLDNILPESIKPTVIVMNPPFSATAGRLKRNATMYGAKHVEQALSRLEPGGRLVAIVGRGMTPAAPTFKAWFKKIGSKYAIRANIGISGQEYRKYGTTFDNRLLIFDKVDPKRYSPVVAEIEKVDELPKLLEGVRNDRPQIPKPREEREREALQPALPEPPEGAEGAPPVPRAPRPEPVDLVAGQKEVEAGQREPGRLPEQPAEREPEAPGPMARPGQPGAPGQPPEPSPRPVGGPELGPPGERPKLLPPQAGELSLDELAGLIDDVAAEEGLEVGARPPTEKRAPEPKPAAPKAEREGPKESDFDEIADIINDIEVREAQAPYGDLQHPEAYAKAKPVLARTYQASLEAGQSPKEWIRTVLTGLSKRDVNPDIAKNWILYFYANDRPAKKPAPEQKRIAIAKAKKKIREIQDKIYERYQPTISIEGMKKHPTTLDESAALADTTPPPATYETTLPKEMITSGALSDAQLEFITYAGQAHDQILPNGERKGVFAGHGTGVGKGRIIAGIILDNWNKGRKKAVWISETGKLIKDARRDLGWDPVRKSASGIGWKDGSNQVFALGAKHKLGVKGTEFPQKEGILFTTYGTLRSNFKQINTNEPASFQNMRVRINQIVDWLGDDFDGVIAFDESHNMANATESQTERGRKKAADQALAGVMLQNRLPKARIIYVSATGATEVSNFAYADRLGLWGEGTAFGRKSSFINAIESAGLAGMELVARDLKSQGLYLAPTLSYDGVNYDRIVHPLDDKQRAKYDELAGAWQLVLNNIRDALEVTGAQEDGNAKRNIWSQFWGGHQRFFNQVITTMQMGSAIKHIEDQIEADNSVVLQLVNHGGAQLERVTAGREEGQALEDLDFTPRQALMEYIENSFPVQQYEHYVDEDGNEGVRPVFDSQGKPVLNREAVRMREEMLAKIGSIAIPNSPLDLILEHFGTANVAEVTGRKRRIVYDPDEGKLIEEKWSDAKANADAEAFMQDDKRILVFSEKGGTGRSYHADLDTDNHRKRIHYLIQPGWRADKAIQGLGRTHRSNQAQPPEYFLITTDLNAQKRFISSIARRLDQLGALTKGQRQTGSQGIFQARDNLESEYARIGLYQLFHDIVAGNSEVTLSEFEEQTALHLTDSEGAILSDLPPPQKFMNRLLSMKIADQNKAFDEWSERIDAAIDAAASAGTLDIGIETITGLSIKKAEDKIVNTVEETGAQTRYVKLQIEQPSNRKAWDQIVADKFYQNKASGKIWAASIIRTATDKSGNVYEYRTLTSPAGSMQRQRMADLFTQDEEAAKWDEIKSEPVAQTLWDQQYQQTSPTTTRDTHIMTGALLPIWDRLQGAATVYRMQTDEGERILGRVIHQNKINDVLQNLGIGVDPIDLSGDEVSSRIIDENAKVRMANNWRMKRVQVSGEERIELLGPDFDHWDELKKAGVIIEKIQYQTRYFIPVGAKSGSAIEAVTKYKPISHIEMPYAGPSLKETVLKEPEDLLERFGNGRQVQLQLFGGNQLNLFTDTAKKKGPEPRQTIILQKTGDISHYGTKVRNAREAGGLISFLVDKAAEEVYTVATDAAGNVLQIHKVSKGSSSASAVPVVETGGTFLREPDAKYLYFIHNHPSGRIDPSPEDLQMTRTMHNIGQLRNIEVIPVIISNEWISQFDPFGKKPQDRHIMSDEIKRRVQKGLNTKLPVKERFVRPLRGMAGAQAISNSREAVDYIREHYNDAEGILFQDAGNIDLGFMPWPKGEKVREIMARIIAEAESLNARAMIFNWKDPAGQAMRQSRLDFLKAIIREQLRHGLTLHEVLMNGQSTRDPGILTQISNAVTLGPSTDMATFVNDDILFSRKIAPPEVSLPAADIRAIIDPMAAKMANGPSVQVLDRQVDLPLDVRKHLREVGGENDLVVGAFLDDSIYLVAENIEHESEAIRTLLHESVGHYGLRGVLGDRLIPMLQSVYAAKRPHIEAIATEYGYNLRTKEGRLEAAEEWLAREAEVNPKSSWIDRLVTMFRAWLRRINPKLKLADAEIRALLGRARQYVNSNQKVSVFPPIAFNRIPEIADRWYSQMEASLVDKLPDRGTAASYTEMINGMAKSGRIKREELEWSGLLDWLAEQKGKMGKDDILVYVADNKVQLEEVVKEHVPGIDIDDRIGWEDTLDPEQDGDTLMGWFEDPLGLDEIGIQITKRIDVVGEEQFELWIHDESYGSFDTLQEAKDYAQAEMEGVIANAEQFGGTAEFDTLAVTKFEKWQEPGGEAYKELLIKLPVGLAPQVLPIDKNRVSLIVKSDNKYTGQREVEIYVDGQWRATRSATRDSDEEIIDKFIKIDQEGRFEKQRQEQIFRTRHWDEPNVVVHARFNERIDRDGNKIVFIEEIQSDWHQRGRREGYRTRPNKVEARKNKDGSYTLFYEDGTIAEKNVSANRVGERLAVYKQDALVGVPDAPFKKTWRLLAMKRMVRWAAENDFDRIAWTPGAWQADRYDLSRHVDEIEVTPRTDARTGEETREVSIKLKEGTISSIDLGVNNDGIIDNATEADLKGKNLADVVGKDLADKIMKKNRQTLEGLDLKIGGEGLRRIYDVILPSELKKYFGKDQWGKPKIEPTAVNFGQAGPMGEYTGPFLSENELKELSYAQDVNSSINMAARDVLADMLENDSTFFDAMQRRGNIAMAKHIGGEMAWTADDRQVLSMTITPKMKSKALYQGMPMFARKRQGDIDIMNRLPEDVKHRFAQRRGVPKTPWKERAKERLAYMRSLRHHFPGLSRLENVTEAAQLGDILRQHQEVPETSKDQAVRAITRFTKPLSQSEYEIFRIHVILSDMMRDIDSGLLSDINLKEGQTLPFGFKNEAEVRKTFEVFEELADENPKVRKSINARREMINNMVRQLVKYKILKKEVLKHKDYFHHQVLSFWAGNQMKTVGTSSADVRTHWRPWMTARKGSFLDYNTEYVEAEFAAMAQQIAQLETAKTLEKIKKIADVYKDLKTAAKFENLNRFYDQTAKQLSKMFGQDITAAEVMEDKELDPLFSYRQNIAMASAGLRKMAYKDKLEVDSEWDDVVDALAEEHELAKMGEDEFAGLRDTPEIPDGRYFAFLSYLIEKQKPGAMWAATTFKAIQGRNKAVKAALGDDFVTFRQLIPEGYTVWKPDPKKGWFWANSVADGIVEKIIAGEKLLEDRDVRQVLAKGQELNWVIPEGLAETMDNFRRYPDPNSLGRIADWALRAWKQWILINPRRWIKYNLNNMSGDLDISLAYAPGIATPANMTRALRDLRKWHKRKELPEAVQAEMDNARRKGVIGSGFAVQEVEDVLNLMSMDRWVREVLLGEKPNIAMRYWEKAKGSTVIRENILRLAAYRWFRQGLQEGKALYGASKKKEIDAIKNLDDKAAKLARELIGDYGNISAAGQYIRRRLIPFYSWMEINMPRYVYLMRNLRAEDRHADAAAVRKRMAGIAAKKTLAGAGRLAIKANILMGAVLLWNLLFHRDEWEDLGEAKRRQLHLIVGRREDGTIQTIRFQGALSDALAFFGLEDWPADVFDVVGKKATIQEKMVEVPSSFATKLIHGIRPEPKLLFETLTKEQTYPDPFKPRPIRDTLGHILRTFSLDSIYKQATGKPGRGKTKAQHFLNDLKTLLIYDSDPGEQAYYDTRKLVFDWLDDQGMERPSGKPTNRSNALYYYRQALKYGDIEAAKRYLDKYYDLGGSPRSLRQSIKRAHPLGSLALKHRFKFRQSLSPTEQERLRLALEWYDRIYKAKDLDIRMEVAKERYGPGAK